MKKDRILPEALPGFRWLLTMAWRDSRKSRTRLSLFMSAIVLGVAALVAIFSLSDHVRGDINEQAKELLGADLVLEAHRATDSAVQKMVDTLGDRRSRDCRFASMVTFPKGGGTRLVQVIALEGDYPYYGRFETIPTHADTDFRRGQQALVDKTLMLQYDAKVGDSIRVGELHFVIAGMLTQAPGRTGVSTTIAPPVYIPFRYLEQTGLLQKGSRFTYSFYFRYADPQKMNRQLSAIQPVLEHEGLNYETVASRKKDTGRQFEDLSQFLTLIGFVALLLGCIGIAGSINIYIREKIPSIAILRCLGAGIRQTFLIYLIQVTLLGWVGASVGAGLGTAIQQLLPLVIKDILPVRISTGISWLSIAKGVGIGVVASFLFALLPLLSIHRIAPLYTLRAPVEPGSERQNLRQILVFSVILVLIILFTRWQMQSWTQALIFSGGILAAFLLLTGVALLLRSTVRRFFPHSLNYLLRQGFANLYRPNNQTILLVVTIGLGAMFIGTLYFVQDMLMKRVAMSADNNQPNIVLFDIQPGQKAAVEQLVKAHHLPVYQNLPVVTMRIEEIKGHNAFQAKEDSISGIPARAFDGELRVTYRDSLTNTEELTAGKFETKPHTSGEPVYISLDESYARRLRVSVGDSMVFNVQGMLLPAVVGSLRKVDWQRFQTNFRVVFPLGVLEEAPRFYVIVTRVPSAEVSAGFQRATVKAFPNISIIDLALVLKVLDEVLRKMGFVIRFMTAFSIATGLVVLMASIYVSKVQRVRETVLLRTLGASRKQIFTINVLEYCFLGMLAAGTGLLLSLAGGWALSEFSFDASFRPPFIPIVVIFFSITLLTALIGLLSIRNVVSTPPLEILRKEI